MSSGVLIVTLALSIILIAMGILYLARISVQSRCFLLGVVCVTLLGVTEFMKQVDLQMVAHECQCAPMVISKASTVSLSYIASLVANTTAVTVAALLLVSTGVHLGILAGAVSVILSLPVNQNSNNLYEQHLAMWMYTSFALNVASLMIQMGLVVVLRKNNDEDFGIANYLYLARFVAATLLIVWFMNINVPARGVDLFYRYTSSGDCIGVGCPVFVDQGRTCTNWYGCP
jgi:hypothetical protein